MDNVFTGDIAERWHSDVGAYGDHIRMALLNHILAGVLDRVAATDVRDRTNCSKDHICRALENMNICGQFANRRTFNELLEWHRDVESVGENYPNLNGTRLWDLGCGNAYLGAWLSALGVGYLGLEPSADLIEVATRDVRLKHAVLESGRLRDFCANHAAEHPHVPTMISIVSVLEHIDDPEASLGSLAAMLYERRWHDVPVFVATLDPDFFLPGLPNRAVAAAQSMPYGDPASISLRDPAHWEEMFARAGLAVLEQRPLHIGLLPEWLSADLRTEYAKLHVGAQRQTPARQGPFYLWLLGRERGMESNWSDTSPPNTPDAKAIEYDAGEVMALMGNLGARVHHVKSGNVEFKSDALRLNMKFGQGQYLGQLELSGNYVSSRVLGVVRAFENTSVLSTSAFETKGETEKRDSLSDRLFLSMLSHFDSVRYSSLLTPQRITGDTSSVIKKGSLSPYWVRNFSGALLQSCSDAVAERELERYRSRLLVELDAADLSKMIYGSGRAPQDWYAVTPFFVQSEVIDCFSSYLIEISGIQDNVDSAQNCDDGLLHIGWLAAQYLTGGTGALDSSLGATADPTAQLDQLCWLAVAISAMLGCQADQEAFRDDLKYQVGSESRKPDGERRARSVGVPKRGPGQIRAHICQRMFPNCPEVNRFLEELSRLLAFRSRDGGYQKDHGMSELVVVRDLWALLACVTDDASLWSYDRKKVPITDYIRAAERKERVIAYLQECIIYIGCKVGITASPW